MNSKMPLDVYKMRIPNPNFNIRISTFVDTFINVYITVFEVTFQD